MWNVNPEGKSDRDVALEGLAEMEKWMKNAGLVMKLGEFGVSEKDINAIAESVLVMDGGYKKLNKDEIRAVLRKSL